MNELLLLLLLASEKGRESPVADRAQAYYHFSAGLQARFSGDFDQALASYRRAQKLDPTSVEIHIEMARVLRDAGKMKEAAAAAREAVRIDAGNADGHLILAQFHQSEVEERGEAALRDAAAEYDKALERQPLDPGTLLTLAAIRGQLQEPAAAARAWERYLAFDPGNFEAYLQLGAQYLAQGDGERAALALQKATELQPASARAYHSLAEIYAKNQQADQAILNFRKALELDPKNLRLRIQLAEVLLRAARAPEALTEADAVMAADPKNRFGLELRGHALRDLKRLDEAARVAAELLQQAPLDPGALYLNVTILEARRDYAGVVAAVEAILARPSAAPGSAPDTGNHERVFLRRLGLALQQLGRHREAADALLRAQTKAGDPDASLLGAHVEALLLAKDTEGALAAVRKARIRFPEDADLATLEANALLKKGDLTAALAIVSGLRERSPRDPDVLAAVADFFQKAKLLKEAETALREALVLQPRSLRALFQLGAVLERQKRHDDSEAAFRQALAVQPDAAPILNYLGYMNADRGVRLPEALSLIEKAVSLDPENGAYLDSLGWALFRLGRTEEAEGYLRKAVAKGDVNAVVLDHYGDVLRRRGHMVQALASWRRALTAEDEAEELDRSLVERKINEVQASVDAPSPEKRQ